MKRLMIIGAGIGQVNLVKLAKQMGLHVIVVSPKGYPAIEYADELFECDIYDFELIVDFAKRNHIDAVTSDQNDLLMPTVAYVSETLGLPGNTYEQVMSYCDKNRFRQICSQNHVPVPNNIQITDDSIPSSFTYHLPWIVKPSDSQSSIGVSKITAMDDYKNAVNYALSKSRQHKAILEQFVDGREYVCEGFVFHGRYYNLSFGDRIYFDNTLIPSQTIFPSLLSDEVKINIIRCEEKIAGSIGPLFGIIHSEYIVNEKYNDFCIVESAIRGGGVYISSHLIPMSTGCDINTLLLQCALNEYVDVERCLSNLNNDVAAYLCFTLPEGIITDVSGVEQISAIPGVEMCDIRDVEIGTKSMKMTEKGARKGPILIRAKNRIQLQQIEQSIKDTLIIKVNSCTNNSIIWR